MKEYSLSSLSNKEPDYGSGNVSRASQNQPPANVSKDSAKTNQAKDTPRVQSNSAGQSAGTFGQSAGTFGQPQDTFLRFKVDENTNDVTVYVLDRTSRQVLRTIPADQMNKLQAGDLLDLLS